MPDPNKLILRTSDRGTFKRCRQLWDFTSKIRQNWEYVPGVEPLDFGTAIHAALEVYYDPQRWRDDRSIVHQESILAFFEHMKDWRARLKKSQQWDLMESKWNELDKLGRGILTHFFKWAPEQDTFWEPVKVEIEFEVPIPVPFPYLLPGPFKAINGTLHKHDMPILYQGRIDLIVKDTRTGNYYIVDHKTRGKFGDYSHYELDVQCSSYAWAIQKILGINISGIIFQELRKKAPEKPAILKSGRLSENKSQNTTVAIYKQTIRDLNYSMDDYADFLAVLAENEQEYFRRIQVDRTAIELESTERHILNEALDMFGSPRIYPNPSDWNCNGCVFREPCIMSQDGSDVEFYLDNSLLFERRS